MSSTIKSVLSSCSSPAHKKNFTVAAIGHFVPFIRLGSPAWMDRTMVILIIHFHFLIINFHFLIINFHFQISRHQPLFSLSKAPHPQGGMEPQIVQAFAAKFGLNLNWFDAKYSWGKLVEETQRCEYKFEEIKIDQFRGIKQESSRWNGVVGHVLYGEADIGISNIDITQQRLL